MAHVSSCACSTCVSLAWIDVPHPGQNQQVSSIIIPALPPTTHEESLDGMNHFGNKNIMETSITYSSSTHSETLTESLRTQLFKTLTHSAEQEKRQVLGEHLYPLVEQQLTDLSHLAGKVTGMLLELDHNEILHLIESSNALNVRVKEVIAILCPQEAKQSDEVKIDVELTEFELPVQEEPKIWGSWGTLRKSRKTKTKKH